MLQTQNIRVKSLYLTFPTAAQRNFFSAERMDYKLYAAT